MGRDFEAQGPGKARTVNDLVVCRGCSTIAGQEVKHLPPPCEYQPGAVNPVLPGVIPAEAVREYARERVEKTNQGRLEEQVDRLAQFILETVPGEPSQDEGAVDTAIRVLRRTLMAEAQKGADWGRLDRMQRDLDKLSLYFRQHYQEEIDAGKHARFDCVSACAIYYLGIERDLNRRGFWGRVRWALLKR